MHVSVWLLLVTWFYTWAEHSHTCKCHDVEPAEHGLDKRSKTWVKEHPGHGVRHHHKPHRSRPHRRKGEPSTLLTPEAWRDATCCMQDGVLSCNACAFIQRASARLWAGINIKNVRYFLLCNRLRGQEADRWFAVATSKREKPATTLTILHMLYELCLNKCKFLFFTKRWYGILIHAC